MPLSPPDAPTPATGVSQDLQVQRAALLFALQGARVSVPMMWLAVAVALAPAWVAQRHTLVFALGALALLNGVWRLVFVARVHSQALDDPACLRRARLHIEGNAAVSGLLWGLATWFIYPQLEPRDAGVHVALLTATTAMAAFYLSLVGRSFLLISLPMLAPLVWLSLFDGRSQSTTVAAVSVVFLLGGLAATRRFREAVLTGLRHNVQADALNGERREARDRAEAAAQARAQFLAVMSHEIRTPLNGVLGTLDLLSRSRLQPQQQRWVQVARSSGQGLLLVLNDALDHAQLEAGALRLALGPVAPRQLVAECQALFAATAQARGLRWNAQVAEDVPDWVQTDAQRLRQVLLNLLGNALKFTERGGVVLRVSSAKLPQLGLRFEIEDTGPGIEAAQLPLLFQSFTQLEAGPTRRHGGTGLGLAISQRLVQALGGEVGVHSQPGVGSCFHFQVPAAAVAPPPVRLAAQHPSGLAWAGTVAAPTEVVGAGQAEDLLPRLRGRVLVAEDNEVNRLITAGMLEALGLVVVEAADGEQAWSQLLAGGIDLALVDMQMPLLDGAGLARRWRAYEAEHGRARLPMLALTANAAWGDQQGAQAAGMDLHLAKPCAMGTLAQALARWLPPAGD